MAQDKILGTVALSESATVQSGNLQSILDGFSAPTGGNWSYAGGILRLGRGDFYGNLVLNTSRVTIEGEGYGTVLHGSVSIQSEGCRLRNLVVRAEGAAYGVKIYRPLTLGGVGVSRCSMEDVFVGATSEGAGNGPVVGLWLDGAILCTFDRCTFAFNTGSGVYSDTSHPTGAASTNVNTFRDCTLNGNGRYGYEGVTGTDGISSQLGNRFLNGNIESNGLGAVLADGHNLIEFRGVDFENTKVVTDLMAIGASQPVTVENCNFVNFASAATRAAVFSTCGIVRFVNNRIDGFPGGANGTAARVVIFDENCSSVVSYGNQVTTTDGYIQNRSAM